MIFYSLRPVLGTEQEWKLAERSMEAASNELYSAANNLHIASLKVKSASGHASFLLFKLSKHIDKHTGITHFPHSTCTSCYLYGFYEPKVSFFTVFSIPFTNCMNILVVFVGDLQSTLLSMRDCAYEASVSLSAFGSVSRNHTALTSECGSMLEEVTQYIYKALEPHEQ